MTSSKFKIPLGKGLSTFLGPDLLSEEIQTTDIKSINIFDLCPGQYQPRQNFDPLKLEFLVSSIREHGIIQPILIRPIQGAVTNYEIIAGERRWQAAKIAGLETVPVIIRDMPDSQALETALIENIQRHDLTALEEAVGYKRLIEEFSYTQDKLSKVLGKSRSHIANHLRLLNLPEDIKVLLDQKKLTFGHAKLIAGLNNIHQIVDQIIKRHLSVRQTEQLIQNIQPKKMVEELNLNLQYDLSSTDIQDMEKKLTGLIGAKVELNIQGQDKKMTVWFKKYEQLDAFVEKLNK